MVMQLKLIAAAVAAIPVGILFQSISGIWSKLGRRQNVPLDQPGIRLICEEYVVVWYQGLVCTYQTVSVTRCWKSSPYISQNAHKSATAAKQTQIENQFVLLTLPGQECEAKIIFMQNYAPKLLIAFKIVHSCCF